MHYSLKLLLEGLSSDNDVVRRVHNMNGSDKSDSIDLVMSRNPLDVAEVFNNGIAKTLIPDLLFKKNNEQYLCESHHTIATNDSLISEIDDKPLAFEVIQGEVDTDLEVIEGLIYEGSLLNRCGNYS